MGRQTTDWLILTTVPTLFPIFLVIMSPFMPVIKIMVIGASLTLYTISNLTNSSGYKHNEPVFVQASMITGFLITLNLIGFGVVYSFSSLFMGVPGILVGMFFALILVQTGRRETRYIKRIQRDKITSLRRARKGLPENPIKTKIQIIREREAEVERRALARLEVMLDKEGQQGTG